MRPILAAAALSIAIAGSGCTVPRTALVIGTVGAIAGGMIINGVEERPPCDAGPYCGLEIIPAAVDGATYAVGGTILAISAGIILSGLIGLGQEEPERPAQDPKAGIVLTTAAPAAPPVALTAPTLTALAPTAPTPAPDKRTFVAAGAPLLAPATPAEPTPEPRAARAQRQSRLALQIRLAARADRCAAATFMAQKLTVMDPELTRALIAGDEYVAYCFTTAPSRPTAENAVP